MSLADQLRGTVIPAVPVPFDADGVDLDFEDWVADVSETGAVQGSANFPDPERTIATYAQSMGLNPSGYQDGLERFLLEAPPGIRNNFSIKQCRRSPKSLLRK